MNHSYANDSVYTTHLYSTPTQVYYIIVGTISILLNLYLIFLFVKYSKLRENLCNWLIIFVCLTDILIGVGTVSKAIVNLIIIYKQIFGINFYLCTTVNAMFSIGYRVGQSIALIISIDRFLAIWKPTLYAKRQGNVKNFILATSFTLLLLSAFILFVMVYGVNTTVPAKLSLCTLPSGALYFRFTPIYSLIISFAFVLTYSMSLILFTRQNMHRKRQQAQSLQYMSKVQRKIFISVSITLFCYSIFYVLPTILQTLNKYFGFPTVFFDMSTSLVNYGAELNGCISIIIFLCKHHEFKESSWRFLYGLMKKQFHPNSDETNTSKRQNRKFRLKVFTTKPMASVS